MELKLLVVDDEFMILDNIRQDLQQCPSVRETVGFTDAAAALDWFAANGADAAVLDIQMGGMNGITLAEKLRELRPDLPVLFLTGYLQYAQDAFRVHADAYLQKPVTPELAERELQTLAKKGVFRQLAAPRLRVCCFGFFEVFTKAGTPMHFTMAKCKELLALLINQKGASMTMGELATQLWENRLGDAKTMALLRRTISDLKRDLERENAAAVLLKQRNTIAVATALLDCDYYRWEADHGSVPFYGEYMAQYSWSEYTTGILCREAGLL